MLPEIVGAKNSTGFVVGGAPMARRNGRSSLPGCVAARRDTPAGSIGGALFKTREPRIDRSERCCDLLQDRLQRPVRNLSPANTL